MSPRRGRIGPYLVIVVLPVLLSAAPAPKDEQARKTETPAEKIHKALDQIIPVDQAGGSLDGLLKAIKQRTRIPIAIDAVLQQHGVALENMPVSVKADGIRVRAALRKALGPYHLDFAVVGDQLVITTEGLVAYRQLRQRVDVDFDQVPLQAALARLARETGVTLLVDRRVAREAKAGVSLQLKDVTLETAVRLLVNLAGLKAVRVGNVVFVTSRANANEIKADPELAPPGGGDGVVMPLDPAGVAVPGGKVIPLPANRRDDGIPPNQPDKPTGN